MKTSPHNCNAKVLAAIVSICALTTSAFGQGTINFNHPPVVAPQTVTVDEGSSIDIDVTAFDPDGDTLRYMLYFPPRFGTLSGDFPHFTYKPDPNFSGEDRFTYKVFDRDPPLSFPFLGGVVGFVGINVRATNDPPMAQIQLPNAVQFAGYPDLVAISGRCNAGANVVLDGTASEDINGNLMTFSWWEGTNNLATTGLVTNTFSIGLHEVYLSVSDGFLSDYAFATFRVITPCEAISAVQLVLEDSSVPQNRKRPLSLILSNAQRALMRGNTHASVAELAGFNRLVDRHIAPLSPDLAVELKDSIALILDAVDDETTVKRFHRCPRDSSHLFRIHSRSN